MMNLLFGILMTYNIPENKQERTWIMKIRIRLLTLILCVCMLISTSASASFKFSDDRFQGVFTTENLDQIIEEYELYDGWYWTSPPFVTQTFHGVADMPGWTDTAVNVYHRESYVKGQFGCRWLANKITKAKPYGTFGECYGFASFIGYLLSGEYNPHHKWNYYYDFEKSGGLKVGDILRTEFTVRGKKYTHSAVVYSVTDDEVLFIQVSGSTYNRISIGTGYMDGYHDTPSTMEELKEIHGKKICRSPLNDLAVSGE